MIESMTAETDGRTQLVRDLSFASIEGERLQLWQPVRTGDYASNCRQGQAYGREMVARLQADGGGPLLGQVCQAIGAQGVFGGVEVGFFAAVSEAAAGL
jgi:hypothetical protein